MEELLNRKRDEATSEDALDTAPDSPVENDSDGGETASETAASERIERTEGESVVSQNDASSEDALDAASDSPVENNGDGGEISPEEDAPTAVQPDALAEVNQSLSELRQLFENQTARNATQNSELRQLFESQIARNATQNKMFDAIHREMKEYKENSLLVALHKPIIQNLIGFYDNFTLIESQLNDILNGTEGIRSDDLSQFQKNLENVRFELEEVLYRLDVTPYEERLETLDRKLHKTLATKPADTPEQDGKVAEVHKIGFYWGDKMFRPEEVTIFRYTEQKGEETDG